MTRLRSLIVSAGWDQMSNVWTAQSVNFKGLTTEADSLDDLAERVAKIARELFGNVPIELVITLK